MCECAPGRISALQRPSVDRLSYADDVRPGTALRSRPAKTGPETCPLDSAPGPAGEASQDAVRRSMRARIVSISGAARMNLARLPAATRRHSCSDDQWDCDAPDI